MRRTVRQWLLVVLFIEIIACGAATAQKYEFALTGGAYVPAGIQTDVSVAGVVEGTFAGRVFSVPLASIYIEVPVARTFDVGLNSVQGNYVGTFVTPGLKLKLAPSFFASPYVAGGVGVAHISTTGAPGFGSRSDTSAAIDVGGGLDIKVFPFISLRGEVRNINSGGLGFALPGITGRQNNLLVTGGLVLRL